MDVLFCSCSFCCRCSRFIIVIGIAGFCSCCSWSLSCYCSCSCFCSWFLFFFLFFVTLVLVLALALARVLSKKLIPRNCLLSPLPNRCRIQGPATSANTQNVSMVKCSIVLMLTLTTFKRTPIGCFVQWKWWWSLVGVPSLGNGIEKQGESKW
jgi:hypothetical protein